MSEKKKVAKKACELCKEEPATVLCAECCRCYCDECSEFIHTKGSMKRHKTEVIPEGMVVYARCPRHKDVPLKMFCVDEVKLCCGICKTEKLHKGHNVVKLSEVAQDNEVFSASEVRERFADVLERGDELNRKIEEAIENIRKEENEALDKIRQTFEEVHDKLEEEESKIMEELERVCNESEEVLQNNLDSLREIRKNNRILNEADTEIQERKKCSRLMKLNLVCSMKEQREKMEELHKTMMTDLKIEWDSEERKLSFTRTLFNGAPIPRNIIFPSILTREMEISWDCYLRMSEEDKKVECVVEMKKRGASKRKWKEVYSGADNKCSVSRLDKDTEYNVRVKCVIGELQGGWSDVANVKTKKVIISIDSGILVNERKGDVLEDKLFEWCGTNEFELLYRGTKDGFGANDFHRACDNKGKTLVLIKNTNGHIFGGFATIPWASPSGGTYKQAPGSFLFTLTNMYGIKPTRFNLKNENDGRAIHHDKQYGPIFGGFDGLWIYPNCNTNTDSNANFSTYNDTTGKEHSIFSSNTNDKHFLVQEIEVFRVSI